MMVATTRAFSIRNWIVSLETYRSVVSVGSTHCSFSIRNWIVSLETRHMNPELSDKKLSVSAIGSYHLKLHIGALHNAATGSFSIRNWIVSLETKRITSIDKCPYNFQYPQLDRI